MTALTSVPFTDTVVHFLGKEPVSHLRSIDTIEYNGAPEKVLKNYTSSNIMPKPLSIIYKKTDKAMFNINSL